MEAPTGKEKHDLLKAFTSGLRSKTKHMQKPPVHLQTYPAQPESLPKQLYDRAYLEEKPFQKGATMTGLGAHVVPYRGSHTLVRDSKSQGSSSSTTDPLGFCMQFMQAACAHMMRGGSQEPFPGLPGFEVFAGKRKNKALEDALPGASATSKLSIKDKDREDSSQNTTESQASNGNTSQKPSPHLEPAAETSMNENNKLFDLNLPAAKKPADASKHLEEMAEALSARTKARKTAKAEEKEASSDGSAPAKPAAKGKAKAKAKSKASCPKVKKTEVKTAMPKTPKGKGSKKDSPQSSEKHTRASAEQQQAPPQGETFFWGGGKVHRSDRTQCWRVFLCKTDRNDKKVAFKGDPHASFVKALQLIEKQRS